MTREQLLAAHYRFWMQLSAQALHWYTEHGMTHNAAKAAGDMGRFASLARRYGR